MFEANTLRNLVFNRWLGRESYQYRGRWLDEWRRWLESIGQDNVAALKHVNIMLGEGDILSFRESGYRLVVEDIVRTVATGSKTTCWTADSRLLRDGSEARENIKQSAVRIRDQDHVHCFNEVPLKAPQQRLDAIVARKSRYLDEWREEGAMTAQQVFDGQRFLLECREAVADFVDEVSTVLEETQEEDS